MLSHVKITTVPPIKRILVPLDGSPQSESVLPYLRGLAAHVHAQLVLLSCAPAGMKSGVPEQAYLERLAAPLRKHGLDVVCAVQHNEPAAGIVAASQQYETDIIAISTNARPLGEKDVIGTVVRDVLTSRAEPVLILREEDGAAARDSWTPPAAVVVGLDGSALAATALPHAEALARAFGAEIVLVRALLPPDSLSGAARYYGAVDDFAERHLAGVAETFRQRGFEVATRTGHRLADQEVLAAADGWPGSIVVLSTRGMTGHPNMVLGSVTERVIRRRSHPVLAVPPARRG